MIRGIRGATTASENSRAAVLTATRELLTRILEVNDFSPNDIGAIIFSGTPDITTAFPAAAARELGWGDVPLFGAQELSIEEAPALCIRVLILLNSDLPPTEICHVYLGDAAILRPDLAKS